MGAPSLVHAIVRVRPINEIDAESAGDEFPAVQHGLAVTGRTLDAGLIDV
jgi:hypothetical protein